MATLHYGDHALKLSEVDTQATIDAFVAGCDSIDRRRYRFEVAMQHALGHDFSRWDRRCRGCGMHEFDIDRHRLTPYNFEQFLCWAAIEDEHWRRIFGTTPGPLRLAADQATDRVSSPSR